MKSFKASAPFKTHYEELSFTVITTNAYQLGLLASRPPLAVRIFLLMLGRLQPDGSASLGLNDLRKLTGCTDSNLTRALRQLGDAGLIARRERGRYWVNSDIARTMTISKT
jgi:DNA-binding transcriptional ArsR family regulator